MAMSEIKRGLQGIKTTTGLVGSKRVRKPHEAYLELSSLEMEKHRLNREKKNAEARIETINTRFENIDRKEIMLHKFIEKPNNIYDKEESSKRNMPEPVPSYEASSVALRERTITY